jgi:lysozyme
MSPMGLALLAEWEGYALTSYRDSAGYETIGVGHLINDYDRHAWQHLKDSKGRYHIVEEEVFRLLRADLAKVERRLWLDRKTVMENSNIYDSLVSFVFNVGVGVTSTAWFREILIHEEISVAERHFPLWNRAGGRVVRGLTIRRHEELAWMRKGVKA